MRFKTSGDQGGLFDYQERKAELSQRSPPLDRLNERVDWEVFRDVLEKQLNYKHEGRVGGRTPWDPVLMFKIILLQKYFDLPSFLASCLRNASGALASSSLVYFFLGGFLATSVKPTCNGPCRLVPMSHFPISPRPCKKMSRA